MTLQTKQRNTKSLFSYSDHLINSAYEKKLMNVSITDRKGKKVYIEPFGWLTEFINCSYFGFDQEKSVVKAFQSSPSKWGVHFCCARSRFSIQSLTDLEFRMSQWLGGHAITFPSVTSAHASTLPLLASGILLGRKEEKSICLIFDKFAHASMQYLKPVLSQEARVVTIAHNDMWALEKESKQALKRGETPVYLADGIYSMGGLCPLEEAYQLSETLGLYLYIDDAHGTSIFGTHGEGYLSSFFKGSLPERVMGNFSLAKGMGCNGGGVLLPSKKMENTVRKYGQTYAFSGPLDFSLVEAVHASLDLHTPYNIKKHQNKLRENVAYYDQLMDINKDFSPIRMFHIGDEELTLDIGSTLLQKGFFVSTVFFPVVPKKNAQLRICITSKHSKKEIFELCMILQGVVK